MWTREQQAEQAGLAQAQQGREPYSRSVLRDGGTRPVASRGAFSQNNTLARDRQREFAVVGQAAGLPERKGRPAACPTRTAHVVQRDGTDDLQRRPRT